MGSTSPCQEQKLSLRLSDCTIGLCLFPRSLPLSPLARVPQCEGDPQDTDGTLKVRQTPQTAQVPHSKPQMVYSHEEGTGRAQGWNLGVPT